MRKAIKKAAAAAKKNLGRVVVGAGAALAGSSAFATGIDLSTDIATAKTDVTTNGVAVLGVVVAVATFAWIRRVLR